MEGWVLSHQLVAVNGLRATRALIILLVGRVDPTLLAVRYSVGDCTSLTKELLGVGS